MIPHPIDKELQRSRRDNYCRHFDCRQQVLAMGEEERSKYAQAAAEVPLAVLDKYGSDDRSTEDWLKVSTIAVQFRLEPRLVNHWYVSEEGWDEFQAEWLKVDTFESYFCGQDVDK